MLFHNNLTKIFHKKYISIPATLAESTFKDIYCPEYRLLFTPWKETRSTQCSALDVVIHAPCSWTGRSDTWWKQPRLTSWQFSLWHIFDSVIIFLFLFFQRMSLTAMWITTNFFDISKFGAHCQYCEEKSQINTMSESKLESLREVRAIHMNLPFNNLFNQTLVLPNSNI